MKKNYIFKTLITALFFSTQLFSQVNVTLKVDMSGETVSAEGIHVVGSINDWNTSSTPLTQEGATNIYSTTIQLNTGWHEYKFLNGNAWGTEEKAGYPCASSNGNRFLYINDSGNDVVLEVVPFNGCNADSTGFSFTLNVDMVNETISADGVKIAGWFNGWNGDNFKTLDLNGSILSATIRLPTPSNYPIVFEYKYVNGNNWETPSEDCVTVVNTNRIHTFESSGQSINNVFNGCNYTLSLNDVFSDKINISYTKNKGLRINSQKNYNKLNLEIFDLTGRKIESTIISNIGSSEKFIKFKITNLGVVLIKVTDNANRFFTKKVIIY